MKNAKYSYAKHQAHNAYRFVRGLPVAYPLPENEHSLVWRVMSISELQLLFSGRLSLTRMLDFEDGLEGRLPELTERWIRDRYSEDAAERLIDGARGLRSVAYVSCWRMDEVVSDVMWEAYATHSSAMVAAGCRVYDLWELCPKIGSGMHRGMLRFGLVRYLNHERRGFAYRNGNMPLMFKHTRFAWENEVRLVLVDSAAEDIVRVSEVGGGIGEGILGPARRVVPVDPQFISTVILHPNCTPTQEVTVRQLLKQAGSNIEVRSAASC